MYLLLVPTLRGVRGVLFDARATWRSASGAGTFQNVCTPLYNGAPTLLHRKEPTRFCILQFCNENKLQQDTLRKCLVRQSTAMETRGESEGIETRYVALKGLATLKSWCQSRHRIKKVQRLKTHSSATVVAVGVRGCGFNSVSFVQPDCRRLESIGGIVQNY